MVFSGRNLDEREISGKEESRTLLTIVGNKAKIEGKFEGNLKGTGKVEITETGVVDGNIKTDSLIINEGGIFSGKVTRITQVEEKGKKKFKIKEKEEEKISVKTEKKVKEGKIEEFRLGDIDDS